MTVSIKVDGHVDTQKTSSFKLALAGDRARREVFWVTAGSTAHPSLLTAISGCVSSQLTGLFWAVPFPCHSHCVKKPPVQVAGRGKGGVVTAQAL